MGYFVSGKTNQLFKIDKKNLVPAFHELQRMNVNNSLKGGSGSPFMFGEETKSYVARNLKKSYATTAYRAFGWVDWNFDVTCKNLTQALNEFGFEHFKFNKHGDLTYMDFDSKNGDFNYALDAIAPFVSKGGKMHWKGEDGARSTINFNTVHVLTPRQLVLRRNKLFNRLGKIIRNYNQLSYKQLNNSIIDLASDIAKFAVQCGGSLAKQSTKVDLASLPSELMNTLLIDKFMKSPISVDSHCYPNRDLPIFTGNSAMHLSGFVYGDAKLRKDPKKPIMTRDYPNILTNEKLIKYDIKQLAGLDLKYQIKTMLSFVALTLKMQKYSK